MRSAYDLFNIERSNIISTGLSGYYICVLFNQELIQKLMID